MRLFSLKMCLGVIALLVLASPAAFAQSFKITGIAPASAVAGSADLPAVISVEVQNFPGELFLLNDVSVGFDGQDPSVVAHNLPNLAAIFDVTVPSSVLA